MKIFAFNTIRAPYRVDLYNLIGEKEDLTVFFEQEHDKTRNRSWYSNDFKNFKMLHARRWDRSLVEPKFDVLKYINKKEVDLVYLSEWSSITAMLIIAKCITYKIPYLISMDGYIEKKKKNCIKVLIKKIIAKNAKLTIGTGRSTEIYAKSIGFSDDRIYSIGFTTVREKDLLQEEQAGEIKENCIKELGLDKSKKYVLSVGQIVERKGFDLLLDAWKYLDDMNEWELLIVGDGEKKKDILKKIEEDNIKRIRVFDGMDKEQLFKYYKAVDLFVLNTREDIWGLVVNEAMANSLPVITTLQCVAGLELIENNINGFLYDCNDCEMAAKYMRKLMEDNFLRKQISRNNLIKMRNYTVEKEAEKILNILSNI